MSEIANMFGTDSSPVEKVEYPQTLVNVDGYGVRQDLAATAHIILSKYGDIVAHSPCTLSFRSKMLERVCESYLKLKRYTLAKWPLPELEAIRNDVNALAQLNINVSGLVKRLEEIHDAKEAMELLSCHKDESILSDGVISELEKEHELQKAIVQKTQQKVEDIEEKLKTEKAKVEARNLIIMDRKRKLVKFHKKNSLVDDM